MDPDGASWLFGVWVGEQAREATERERPAAVAPSAPTGSVLLARAQGLPAGSGLLVALEQVDVAALSADEAIIYLQEVQRASAWLAGFETVARAQVTDVVVAPLEEQFAADSADADTPRCVAPGFVEPVQVAYAEVSAALRLSPRTGEARILEAEELTTTWKPLLDAMLAGSVTIDHARAIGRELRHLPGYGSSDPGEHAVYAKHCARILKVVVAFAEAKIAVPVNVLVPIDTIVGASDQGGRIGNTPVTADELRDLISDAATQSSTIRRLVTDQAGCILHAARCADRANGPGERTERTSSPCASTTTS